MSKNAVCYTLILICLFTAACLAKYSGGTGEPNDPYLIATPNDLNAIGTDPNDLYRNFKMVADINLASFIFDTAIISPDKKDSGTYDYTGVAFDGIFDGNNHTIENLNIDTGGTYNSYLGLFGAIDANGFVVDLTLNKVIIRGQNFSCYIAGICGINYGKVDKCSTRDQLILGGDSDNNAGICGENYGDISRCMVAELTVESSDSTNLGGVCGTNYGIIDRCFADSEINGLGFSRSHGGLCGFNRGHISNCYAKGRVSGTDRLGGICGQIWGETITNSYSTTEVADVFLAGGFCGLIQSGSIENCFWDINTSGLESSDGGIGLTTVEMQRQSTFADAGWDMVNVWDIGENQTYPFLRTHLPSDINKDDETNFLDLAIQAAQWLGEK